LVFLSRFGNTCRRERTDGDVNNYQDLWVCWADAQAQQRYPALAQQLDAAVCTGGQNLPADCRQVLWADADGLSLRAWPPQPAGAAPTRVDFLDAGLRYRLQTSGKRQGLGKALGLAGHPQPRVLDATAGLGRDALLMAALGCNVELLECARPVYLLLEDGMARAGASDDVFITPLLQRMQLHEGEARQWCREIVAGEREQPDIIYLDPMFPPRSKSARVKKDIALLHEFLGSETDLDGLLEAALAAVGRRVVLKRPPGRPASTRQQPAFTIEGKTACFDVYLSAWASSSQKN
jgi:16S rRNA (guanine1516-N2)-methyltransferase